MVFDKGSIYVKKDKRPNAEKTQSINDGTISDYKALFEDQLKVNSDLSDQLTALKREIQKVPCTCGPSLDYKAEYKRIYSLYHKSNELLEASKRALKAMSELI